MDKINAESESPLLPCPFCGSSRVRRVGAEVLSVAVERVVCDVCGASGPMAGPVPAVGHAARLWNARSSADAAALAPPGALPMRHGARVRH